MQSLRPFMLRGVSCLLFLVGCVVSSATYAHADTIFSYTIQTSVPDLYTGTYSVDTALLDAAVAGSAPAIVPIIDFSIYNFGVLIYSGAADAGSELNFLAGGSALFDWTVSSPAFGLYYLNIGSAGSSVACLTSTCTGSGTWNGAGTSTFTQDPVSPVPESSTLLLLGTGILGVVGSVRRRYVTQQS